MVGQAVARTLISSSSEGFFLVIVSGLTPTAANHDLGLLLSPIVPHCQPGHRPTEVSLQLGPRHLAVLVLVGVTGHALEEVLSKQAVGLVLLPRGDLVGRPGGDHGDVGRDARVLGLEVDGRRVVDHGHLGVKPRTGHHTQLLPLKP